MSGANNIPLGSRRDGRDGTLAQAAASLSGTSLQYRPDVQQVVIGGSPLLSVLTLAIGKATLNP